MKPFNQWNLAPLMIGGLEIIWAISTWINKKFAVYQTLSVYNIDEGFIIVMSITGMLCVIGSIFKCRPLRLYGLGLSLLTLWPTTLFMWSHEIFNGITLSMPWVGLMAVVVMGRETMRKTRNESMDN